jgi:GDP-4-dehydro-6-deoxy-D-mannose reductase
MKSLIIGGAGFVGPYLIKELNIHRNQEVVVTKMPHETIDVEKLKAEGVDTARLEILDLNILEKDAIVALFRRVHPDYIFHLAAQSSVAVSWKNPSLTIDVNIKGGVNVMDALRDLDYKPRILFIGSGEEYGHIREGETPISEENKTRPGNIYAATKACQNMLGNIYAQAYDLPIMMVRAFNHIGPNQTPLFVVADFCKQVAEIEAGQKPPVIYVGNLSAKRDFTDVRDVVRAYALLVESGKAGETYNIGSGHAMAIEDILQMILSQAKCDIQVEVDPKKLRPVDVPIIEADITKVCENTGWTPEIPLSQTIEETLNYWRESMEGEKYGAKEERHKNDY